MVGDTGSRESIDELGIRPIIGNVNGVDVEPAKEPEKPADGYLYPLYWKPDGEGWRRCRAPEGTGEAHDPGWVSYY